MMNAFKTWMTRHAQTAIGTLGRLSEQWLPTSFMVLVIGIALALPACLQVVLLNARLAGGEWNHALEISAYLKMGTTKTLAEQLAESIRKRSEIADVRLVTADEGLIEFRKRSGFGDALTALTDNPLPHALIVRPRMAAAEPADLAKLVAELRQISNVDVVQLDTAWIERFNGMIEVLRRATLVIGILLAGGMIVIIGNAIRTDIQAHRDEIEVTKLVGGSDAFVRRTFLYTGIWFGLAGGVLALVVTYTITGLLGAPIRRLALLYGSDYRLTGLGAKNSLVLLGLAVALGWLGSYLAATRHLRTIEPK